MSVQLKGSLPFSLDAPHTPVFFSAMRPSQSPGPHHSANTGLSGQAVPGEAIRHILIIDDEDDIREVAALSLEATAGWTITTASSGAAGILAVLDASPKPDAILMDVMMPDMDGPTTFRQMQQTPGVAGIPVLLLTAKVQGVDQRRFADLGVAAILFKPFDPLTLANQIAEVLGWSLRPAR